MILPDTMTLIVQKLGVRLPIGVHLAEEPELLTDYLTNQVAAAFTAHVLAYEEAPTSIQVSTPVAFSQPETWWQAWKAEHAERWYGRRLARRRPPRMRASYRAAHATVELSPKELFPHASLQWPATLGAVTFSLEPKAVWEIDD